MITGWVESFELTHGGDCGWPPRMFAGEVTKMGFKVVVDESDSPMLEAGDRVWVTNRRPVSVNEAFKECCERAREGDTNALSALPYMADRILSRARHGGN